MTGSGIVNIADRHDRFINPLCEKYYKSFSMCISRQSIVASNFKSKIIAGENTIKHEILAVLAAPTTGQNYMRPKFDNFEIRNIIIFNTKNMSKQTYTSIFFSIYLFLISTTSALCATINIFFYYHPT
jgi:hypothetical protein